MGNAIAPDPSRCGTGQTLARTRPSRMVLVTGQVRTLTSASPTPSSNTSPGSEDSTPERQIEIWVEAKHGATVGWVMSRVMEELATKEPDVPNIVGLRVVRGKHSKSRSSSDKLACPLGEEPIDMEGELLVDYGQPVLALLDEGDCLECIFEVEMPTPLASSEEQQQSPESRVAIGDFQVVRMLGTGASCRVVQVRRRDCGKFFAVKIMSKRKLAGSTKRLERAIAEKKVLARLQHPFIVSLHWAFQTKGHLFMVLDYCAGGELFYHLQRQSRFSEVDTRFYICEILLAIEYLHSQGIVYRDLKPENCLLDNEGHIRLTDFGLSGVAAEGEVKSVLFQSFVGTVLYLSPEMIRKEGHGPPLDYYCLGCLLYLLLTGSLPHFTGDVKEMMERRAHGATFQPPKHASPVAASLCAGLLDPLPAHRLGTQSARQVKDHEWFRKVNFHKVYRKEKQSVFPNFPPISPLDSPDKCFSSEFTKMPVSSGLDDFGTQVDLKELTIAGFSNVEDTFH